MLQFSLEAKLFVLVSQRDRGRHNLFAGRVGPIHQITELVDGRSRGLGHEKAAHPVHGSGPPEIHCQVTFCTLQVREECPELRAEIDGRCWYFGVRKIGRIRLIPRSPQGGIHVLDRNLAHQFCTEIGAELVHQHLQRGEVVLHSRCSTRPGLDNSLSFPDVCVQVDSVLDVRRHLFAVGGDGNQSGKDRPRIRVSLKLRESLRQLLDGIGVIAGVPAKTCSSLCGGANLEGDLISHRPRQLESAGNRVVLLLYRAFTVDGVVV